MKACVCITAGGTGGHITPGLALAERLIAQGVDVIWVGSQTPTDEAMLTECAFTRYAICASPFRGGGLMRKLWFPWSLLLSFVHCFRWFIHHKPQLVVALGGYASFTAGVLAKLFRARLIICEQNAAAGYVNRLLAYLADRCITAYPNVLGFEAHAKKCLCLGNFIPRKPSVSVCKDPNRFVVLVVGGSQGALCLNQTVPRALGENIMHMDKVLKVIHICGKGEARADNVRALYREYKVHAEVLEFSTQMPELYAQSDALIARSGALTVSEALAYALPAVYVPLKSAVDNHQYYNALFVKKAGAATIVLQEDLEDNRFYDLQQAIRQLCNHTGYYQSMQQAASLLAKPKAVDDFIESVVNIGAIKVNYS